MNRYLEVGIIAVLAASILTMAVSLGEAKTKPYYVHIAVKVSGLQCTDEIYARVSDSYTNPKNGNHDHLVVKSADLPVKATQTLNLKFDPAAFAKKYGYPLKDLREYIELYLNDKLVFSSYTHPYIHFDLKKHDYSFSHIAELNC